MYRNRPKKHKTRHLSHHSSVKKVKNYNSINKFESQENGSYATNARTLKNYQPNYSTVEEEDDLYFQNHENRFQKLKESYCENDIDKALDEMVGVSNVDKIMNDIPSKGTTPDLMSQYNAYKITQNGRQVDY
jgi:hypothetical protein